MYQHQAEAATFSEQLKKELLTIVNEQAKCSFAKREKMWSKYHSFRISENFVKVWSEFLYPVILDVPADKIMAQFVTQDLFEMIIKEHVPSKATAVPSEEQNKLQPTTEELNALRYAAGYVLRSITAKYTSGHSCFKDDILICLTEMEAKLDDEDDALSWTKEWTMRLDRGKLIKVSNIFYALVLAIEMQVHCYFNNTTVAQLSATDEQMLPKDQVIAAVMEDDDVQFYWTMMTVDLEEEANQELLQGITGLWVTIRGFSFTKSWLQMYQATKHSEDAKDTKKKGLRKKLKGKDTRKD